MSKVDLRASFESGKRQNAQYMIIVCDSLDWEDYPVFVYEGEDVNEKIKYIRQSPMQRIMEIYDLSTDRDSQLNEYRSFNYPHN